MGLIGTGETPVASDMQPLHGFAVIGPTAAEYILSTFKSIHDASPLFRPRESTATRILQKFAEHSFSS